MSLISKPASFPIAHAMPWLRGPHGRLHAVDEEGAKKGIQGEKKPARKGVRGRGGCAMWPPVNEMSEVILPTREIADRALGRREYNK